MEDQAQFEAVFKNGDTFRKSVTPQALLKAFFQLCIFAFSKCAFICLVWADNADACSKQYAGTGALKTDYTR